MDISKRLRNLAGKFDEYNVHEDIENEAADTIDRLLILLENAVSQADSWHDECRGGKIEGDELMDEARGIIREATRKRPRLPIIPECLKYDHIEHCLLWARVEDAKHHPCCSLRGIPFNRCSCGGRVEFVAEKEK